jgi:hypothetical protein
VAGPGVGESVLYALDGMWIEEPGQDGPTCTAIVETSRLNYVNSHHNFRDRAEGTAGSTRYVVTLNFGLEGSGWDITLTVQDATTGMMTAGPVRLTTTGGRTGLNTYPSSLPVYVSELMPDNTTGWKNDAGEVSPWIEIFNPSSGDVDLGGYFLSNDLAQPRQWSFPAGTTIARHQHLVIAVSDAPGAGPLTARFRLSPAGGSVRLSNPAGVSPGERVYPPLGANRSAAFSLTMDAFAPAATASPGSGDL